MNFSLLPNGIREGRSPRSEQATPQTTETLVPNTDADGWYFRALEASGVKLNEGQLSAVRHVDGPVRTVAGAGSGKTSVLVARTGYLLGVKKITPENILLVTFTKKAAEEMRERVARLPGLSSLAKHIECGTFHSVFLGILRNAGYKQEIFASDFQKQVVVKQILRRLKLQDSFEAESVLALIGSYKARMIEKEDPVVDDDVRNVWERYENYKYDNDLMDFDDIVTETYRLLLDKPSLLSELQQKYQYVQVDEWQDTNRVQYEVIRLLSVPQNNLFVVGDHRQCIMSFQGADIQIILNFDKDYPDTQTITLDVNYRSTPYIVGLGNAVIRKNQGQIHDDLKVVNDEGVNPRFARPYTTEIEAEGILDEIQRRVKSGERRYGDFAVLYRTMASSRAMIDAMVMKGIPYVCFDRGNLFYDHGIVKPIVSYLRLSLYPLDEQAVSDILPSLYLRREETMEFIERRQLRDPKSHLLMHVLEMPGLTEFQVRKLVEQIQLISVLRRLRPLDAVRRIRMQYDEYLDTKKGQNLTMAKEMVKEMLDEMESSVQGFDTCEGFISFVDKLKAEHEKMQSIKKGSGVDAVSLMTIHKSKGLEFPVVYVIGVSEGTLPHQSAITPGQMKDVMVTKSGGDKTQELLEEERRLMYVAVTRAKQELYVSSPATYRGKQAEMSRFVKEAFGADTKLAVEKKPARSSAWQQMVASRTKTVTAPSPVRPQQNMEEVEAMICTNGACGAWKRIEVPADELKTTCPRCNSPMEKGVKMAISRR